MITTQYGEPVDRVVYIDEKCGMADVEIDGNRKTERRTYMLHQLRADGGIKEILEAAVTRKK